MEPSPPTTKIRSKLFSSLSLLPGKKVSKLTENVIEVFKAHGLHASKIGETGGEYIQLNETIKVKVLEARHRWENGLREKL